MGLDYWLSRLLHKHLAGFFSEKFEISSRHGNRENAFIDTKETKKIASFFLCVCVESENQPLLTPHMYYFYTNLLVYLHKNVHIFQKSKKMWQFFLEITKAMIV